MEKKRILWLLNHNTLRDCEAPMLVDLGFEVFIPKKFPATEANRSASVTYEFDKTLTIPTSLLKKLNEFDFYSSQWTNSLAKQINKYFDVAICAAYPIMLSATAEKFKGHILLRVFGLTGDANTYEMVFSECDQILIDRIKAQNKIWLAESYDNISDNEPYWLKRIAKHLPLGLPPKYYGNQNSWEPLEHKILFVCPVIKTSPYYKQVYQDFKARFRGFPYVVAGGQTVPVTEDPNVLGFVSSAEYARIMRTCKVMFYHSREERHLHYHPLEAMLYGMPVIYMSGGILDHLAEEKLIGSCDSFDEARDKVARILAGDQELINAVVFQQQKILAKFSPEYVKHAWEKTFLPLLEETKTDKKLPVLAKPKSDEKLFRIGIWLHETHPGGLTTEGISRLLAQIVREAQSHKNVTVTVACVSWVKEAAASYMESLGVRSQELEFLIVDRRPPVIFLLYQWWEKWKIKKEKKSTRLLLWNIYRRIMDVAEPLAKRILVQRNPVALILIGLLFLLTLPILFILLILYAAWRKASNSGFANRMASKFEALRPAVNSVVEIISRKIYNGMSESEFGELAKKISRSKGFDVWFLPYPSNAWIKQFKTPVVIAVPDIVYLDFPIPFAKAMGKDLPKSLTGIQKTIQKANAVICYAEYIKNHHIIEQGFKSREDVHVIRHAPISTRELISKSARARDIDIRNRAAHIIQSYLFYGKSNDYVRWLPFQEIDYLFVSSQSRPHKNNLNILAAYVKLLREKFYNLKLVLTGVITEEMREFIEKEHLEFDILSLHALPPKVHAAFYACAKLTIAPTLFEGGLPFVFSESLDVGVPAILSDIPVVRELIPASVRKDICFDPYDVDDIVRRVSWVLDNYDQVLATEKNLYQQMKLRTWEIVAGEYIQVFLDTAKVANKSKSSTVQKYEALVEKLDKPMQSEQEILPFAKLAEDTQLCFIHIPKTAGTSFAAALNSIVSENEILTIKDFSLNKPQNLNQYKVITGHFPYEIQKLFSKTPKFLTFLRDPIERSVSQIAHNQRAPENKFYPLIKDISIDEYATHSEYTESITNLQTRSIGLQIDQVQSLQDLLLTPHKIVSLDLAKERLQTLAFFGLAERYQDSMNLLAYTLWLPPFDNQPALNVSPKRMKKSEISESTMRKIRELNDLDIQLYEFAQQVFEERYNQMIQDLKNNCAFAPNLSIVDMLKYNYLSHSPATQKYLSCKFQLNYPATGWYPPEDMDGKTFTWSSQANSSVIFKLDRTSLLRIKFNVHASANPAILESLSVYADSQPIMLSPQSQLDGTITFEGALLPRESAETTTNFTTISFHVNRTAYPPGMTAETPGARLLGIALNWIEFSPLGE